ncbi:MAG TPA: hypothetical protein VMT11_16755 [Myxococcaceae bacterium]|nr:hypothetical protein [Myxococcaceae bacterium]
MNHTRRSHWYRCASKALATCLLFLGAPVALAADAPASKPVTNRWSAVLYGFAELDAIHDSLQGPNDLMGNAALPRSGTYATSHDQTTFSVRNSRLGLRVGAPDLGPVRASAVAEMDFFGNQPPVSEAAFFNNPTFRIRHVYFKLETPIVDLTVGQTWELFGWQAYFDPASVNLQGLPGQVYSRTAQVRVAKTLTLSPEATLELAIAALRPPQRAGGLPDGQAGVKLELPWRKGYRTVGGASSALDAMAIGVSGALRRFSVPAFESTPRTDVTTTGWGVSVDVLVPIIAASSNGHDNALTFTGSFVRGEGIADLYTGLGGPPFPNLPGTSTPYSAPIDAGLVGFDASNTLQAVSYQTLLLDLQYWLPGSTGLSVAANYSHLQSFNAAELAHGNKNVVVRQQYASGAVFWDAAAPLRFGLEFAWLEQHFIEGPQSVDRRVQLSSWYVF